MSVEVFVTDETTVVEINPGPGEDQFIEVQVTNPETFEVVEVDVPGEPGLTGATGPQGPVGPQGPPGLGSNYSYTFTFATPLTSWEIEHNLNSYAVQVEIFDLNGDSWEAAIRYLTENTIVIEWYFPMSGFARLFS